LADILERKKRTPFPGCARFDFVDICALRIRYICFRKFDIFTFVNSIFLLRKIDITALRDGCGRKGGLGGHGGKGGIGGKGGNFAHSVALWGGGVLGRRGGVGGEDEKKENSKRSFLCLCEWLFLCLNVENGEAVLYVCNKHSFYFSFFFIFFFFFFFFYFLFFSSSL
jgi:hypothetical protein